MSRTAIFLAGFGAGTAVAMFSGLSPEFLSSGPSGQGSTSVTTTSTDTLNRSAADLQQALDAERQKLAMMSADITRLQKDLAVAREAATTPTAEARATVATNLPPVGTQVAALSPEERRQKAVDIQLKIAGLVENKDGAGLVKLLQELKSLGPEGYPTIMEIAAIIDADMWMNGNQFSVKMQDYFTSFPPEIMTWALDAANMDKVPPGFRIHATHAIMWMPIPDKDKIVLDAILRETDPQTLTKMTEVLAHRPDPAIGAKLIERLQSDAALNDEAFGALLLTATRMPGPAVDNYLENALATTPPGPRQDLLRRSLMRRSPPASGFMVDRIVPDSQASSLGIRPGDIILSYGGVNLANSSIARAREQVRGDGPHMLEILRDGSRITINVAPGQIGIDGTSVIKKD
ncbi:MAG: hypothetical protein AB7F75_09325 [Planctomycetota bacterium]